MSQGPKSVETIYQNGEGSAKTGDLALFFAARPDLLSTPAIARFSYDPDTGVAEVRVEGAPDRYYELEFLEGLTAAVPGYVPVLAASRGQALYHGVLTDATGVAVFSLDCGDRRRAFLRMAPY